MLDARVQKVDQFTMKKKKGGGDNDARNDQIHIYVSNTDKVEEKRI
jgi:hypothetical protein